jgi:oligosaccharide repeat unit polymerase
LETVNLLGTESTNVYTTLRDLIEDFGEAGATIFAACIGLLAGRIYRAYSGRTLNTVFWMSAFYASLLFSPIGSFFSFNGAALAWLVGWFVLVRKSLRPQSFAVGPLHGQEAIP